MCIKTVKNGEKGSVVCTNFSERFFCRSFNIYKITTVSKMGDRGAHQGDQFQVLVLECLERLLLLGQQQQQQRQPRVPRININNYGGPQIGAI